MPADVKSKLAPAFAALLLLPSICGCPQLKNQEATPVPSSAQATPGPSGSGQPTPSPSAPADEVLPVAGGSGAIAVSGASPSTISIQWAKGSDNATAADKLRYRVYYSTAGDLDTAAECELNGIAAGALSADLGAMTVTGLASSTGYYFNVVVADEAGNKAAYAMTKGATLEGTAPVPSGSLGISGWAPFSFTVSWDKATDDTSPQDKLQYRVYVSRTRELSTVEDCEAYGTTFGDFETDIGTKALTGLPSDSLYSVNVVVRDEAGNKAAYAPGYGQTMDGTPPTAGGGGNIAFSSSSANSVTLTWQPATDAKTPQAQLRYAVYCSTTSDLSTVAACEASGTAAATLTGQCSYTATGLSPGIAYRFNVVALDFLGNKACYAPNSKTLVSLVPDIRWRFENNFNDSAGTKALTPAGALSFSSAVKREGAYSVSFDPAQFGILYNETCSFNANAMTLVAWIYADPAVETTGSPWIMSYNEYAIECSYDASYIFVSTNSGGGVGAPVSTGTWFHLVFTFDGSAWRIYVNGVLQGYAPSTESIVASNKRLYLGAWSGYLDDVQIYYRALSGTEAAALYGSY